MVTDSRFFGKSRNQKRAENNLGVIQDSQRSRTFRSSKLDMIDKYVESTQYDKLANWDEGRCAEPPIPMRKRKPRVIYPMAKILTDMISTKTLGMENYPTVAIEDDPDTTDLIRSLSKQDQ